MIGERVVMTKGFYGEKGELLQIDHDYDLYKILIDGEIVPLWFKRDEFALLCNNNQKVQEDEA